MRQNETNVQNNELTLRTSYVMVQMFVAIC